MMVYTSGSTGLPKGAAHTQKTALAMLLNFQLSQETKLVTDSVFTMWHPMGHISGTMLLFYICQNRVTAVLHNSNDMDVIVPNIEKYHSNCLFMSPEQAGKLADGDYHKQYDLSSIQVIVYGGCKYPLHIIQKIEELFPNALVINKYGATESLGQVLVQNYGKPDFKMGSVGKVQPNMEMKIVDISTGMNLPENKNGEICFRGPTCFVGYLNNEEKTKETIDELGWYHTGDMGYYDEEHNLFIVDRIKELIKYRHWSVAPAEIEEFLQTHPAVEEACVVGVSHVSGTELIRAYVKVRSGHTITKQELTQYVQDNMGIQKRLYGGVCFVDRLPKTSIDKIDRQYFKKLIKDIILDNEIEVDV